MNIDGETTQLVPVTIKIGHPDAVEIMLIWSVESQAHLYGFPMPVASSSIEFCTAGVPMSKVGGQFEVQLNVPEGSLLHFGYWFVLETSSHRSLQWKLATSQFVKGQEILEIKPSLKQVVTSIPFKHHIKKLTAPLKNINSGKISSHYLSHLLVNDKYEYVFCSIPKNGCSSIKFWFLQTTYPDMLSSDLSIHDYMRENYSLENRRNAYVTKTLKHKFKFAISRNPWSRVVSAYLNKFVSRQIRNPTYPVIDVLKANGDRGPYNRFVKVTGPNKSVPQAHPALTSVDYSQRITFREFVDYLCQFDDEELNNHWRPQWRFLQGIDWDFIGRLENIEHDIKYISRRLNIPEIEFPHRNRTSYVDFQSDIPLADASPAVFLQGGGLPHARQLWTSDLIEKVARRYEKDIQMFGYENDHPRLSSGLI